MSYRKVYKYVNSYYLKVNTMKQNKELLEQLTREGEYVEGRKIYLIRVGSESQYGFLEYNSRGEMIITDSWKKKELARAFVSKYKGKIEIGDFKLE